MKVLEEKLTAVECNHPQLVKLQTVFTRDLCSLKNLGDELAAVERIIEDESIILEAAGNLEIIKKKIPVIDVTPFEGSFNSL